MITVPFNLTPHTDRSPASLRSLAHARWAPRYSSIMKHRLLGLVFLSAGAAMAQGVVLPPDVIAKKPPESASAVARAFAGKWQGQWDGRMPHVLVVEEVKSNTEVQVLYAWQEPPVENAWGAGWYRTMATFEGNTLKVPLRNGNRAWYDLLPDGSLKAGYQRAGSSGQSGATMKRVEP
jgi:hypothetical protein